MSFLEVTDAKGFAWAGEATYREEGSKKIDVTLKDPRRLGITTLGNLAEHPRIVLFRQFLEGWYLSYFVPELARGLPVAGAQKHLNRTGENLANYVQFMERQHSKKFSEVLQSISKKIPGIEKICRAVVKGAQYIRKGLKNWQRNLDARFTRRAGTCAVL